MNPRRIAVAIVISIAAFVFSQEPVMENMIMLSHLPISEIGGTNSFGNDIWGWTDSQTGNEYAIFGRTDGTAFIDITNPRAPLYLGNLPSRTGASTWRDMKVFNDHAFIVSDGNGPHGMQIFDLTQLRGLTAPQNFQSTAVHDSFRNAHNIAINEESGFAYIVGSNVAAGGLHILDINDPLNPVVVGEFSEDGYTHDAQVVTYDGPDTSYTGKEIAFNANEDTLTIADVTNKMATEMLSRTGYAQSQYTHQGWLSEDSRYFFMNDELDEYFEALPATRTHIFDVQDLDDPTYVGFYEHPEDSIDHNLYVKEDKIYAANYSSGLRVVQVNDAGALDLEEVAFFDPNPDITGISSSGLWSVYPFFESGNIIISDINRGLYVLQMGENTGGDFNADGAYDCSDIDALVAAAASGQNEASFDLTGDGSVNLDDVSAWLLEAGELRFGPGISFLWGDANLDGVVDTSDFNAWNSNKFTNTAAWCRGDFNADGVTDVGDFGIWNNNKFQSSADAAAVPEPAGWALAVFAMIGILRMRNGLQSQLSLRQ